MAQTTRVKHVDTELDRGSTAFDVRDLKGRIVGYTWTITQIECVPANEDDGGFYWHHEDQPMQYIEAWGSPTRDGKPYGPAFNIVRVATLDEARSVIAKRIVGARRRDTKKFTKPEVV